MATGICKLTGKRGNFVKAHIIPKALTRPAEKGLPFVQGGQGSRPVRRWDSWYDDHLVIQAGENILTALDTWAIRELRRHELVWSGWGPTKTLTKDHTVLPETPYGVREIQGIDRKKLRLFFLSLLWRAAATGRNEFSDIVLSTDNLEKLRLMILHESVEPLSFYPAVLTQLSTFGVIHNHTPLAKTKVVPALADEPERRIPIFRFYFDGLIAHVHNQASDEGYTESLDSLIAGQSERLTISTVTYERSFQHENINLLKADMERL